VNAVIAAAAELQAVCEAEGWRFCLIGGVALQRWGEARETVDVDLTLLTGFGAEAPFIARLTAAFTARIDDAAAFALANRVLLLRAASGVGLDRLGGACRSRAASSSAPLVFASLQPSTSGPVRPRISSC
jgi:hypothetical protein